jgi:NADP-dependent 3-hydroxy acid dehydrogenase YdfG
MGVAGQVVWVTGAGSGIGRAAAVAFARAGAKVAITGRRQDALEATAALIGSGATIVPADLSDPAAITAAHQAVVERLGVVDILMNNAGSNVPQRNWNNMTAEGLQAVIDVNLRGPFLCTMAVLPGMRAKGSGTLVHIASIAGVSLFPAAGSAYSATKAAVAQMSGLLNAEEGIHGIRSICINPGEVATEIMDRRPVPPSAAERAIMLQAEDVAAAAVFASSLPPRATIADLTILPTDNGFWRSHAHAIAKKD